MNWKLLFLAQLTATLSLTGLIWFVQIVHYPLFARVGKDGFQAYEMAHSNWTTLVIAPPMLIELSLALLWLWQRPAHIRSAEAWVGALLVALIWASTWWFQVPQHNVLATGFDAAAQQFLVASNWIRTLGWSARSGLLLWLTARTIEMH